MKLERDADSLRSMPSGDRSPALPTGARIQRFLSAERAMHWALAIPFVLLYVTALGMVLFYSEPSPRTMRTLCSWLHRGLGIALIALPPAALLLNTREWRAHLENMGEAWRWRREDFRWLVLFPRAAVNPRVVLPEQGKFNAAEKLNFMMVSATYPLYIITGLMVWMPGVSFFSYVAHVIMAVMGLPLVAGHIFMATANPDTRLGFSGMITGWVDREWARHHYRRWFRERIEGPEQQQAARELAARLARPARIRCASCENIAEFGSWRELIQRSFQVDPLCCPTCQAPVVSWEHGARPVVSEAIARHLELRGAESPFEPQEAEVA